MNLPLTEPHMIDCQKEFNKLNPERAIFFTHYEFAKHTEIKSPDIWKQFLMNPTVAEWMSSEVETIRQVQLRRIVNNASDESRSVGTAQMINALDKVSATTQQRTGNTFVYCYTPLNEREMQSPNVKFPRKEIGRAHV